MAKIQNISISFIDNYYTIKFDFINNNRLITKSVSGFFENEIHKVKLIEKTASWYTYFDSYKIIKDSSISYEMNDDIHDFHLISIDKKTRVSIFEFCKA